jgi:hypothetical protein
MGRPEAAGPVVTFLFGQNSSPVTDSFKRDALFKKGVVMGANAEFADIDPECVDVVMQELPKMYRTEGLPTDHWLVYGLAYHAAREELRRGATAAEIRGQTSRILRYIDQSDRDLYDKEHFAAIFARAVEDALQGRAPCILH